MTSCLFFHAAPAYCESPNCEPTKGLTASWLSDEQTAKVRSKIGSYLCSQWTKERIQRFCLPTTRHLTGQNLVPPTERKLKGQLYPESEHELGRVEWTAYFDQNADEPFVVSLDVSRPGKHQYWLLSILEYPARELFMGESFDKYLVRRLLMNAEEAYSYQHFFGRSAPSDYVGLGVSKIVEVIHDRTGRNTGFTALLQNGAVLTANLDTNMSMSNILVDGLPNKYWTAINDELVENIEHIYDKL